MKTREFKKLDLLSNFAVKMFDYYKIGLTRIVKGKIVESNEWNFKEIELAKRFISFLSNLYAKDYTPSKDPYFSDSEIEQSGIQKRESIKQNSKFTKEGEQKVLLWIESKEIEIIGAVK